MQRNPETGLPGESAEERFYRATRNTYSPDWEHISELWKETANKAEDVIKAWQRLAFVGVPTVFVAGYALGAWLGWP